MIMMLMIMGQREIKNGRILMIDLIEIIRILWRKIKTNLMLLSQEIKDLVIVETKDDLVQEFY